MTVVTHCIRDLDSKVWHGVEKIACAHPNASRVLALPIAIGTLIRDTLATPAKCVEEIASTIKSIKAYRAEQNPKEFFYKRNEIEWHSLHAVKYLVMTPFSPLVGLVDAIVSFVLFGSSPFKRAKINAAKQDFDSFLEEKNYSASKSYINHELIDFANEVEFAKAAWNRFKQQVLKARNHEEVKNLHFLDNSMSKKQLINEVALKKEKFNEVFKVYLKKRMELNVTYQDNQKAQEVQDAKLKQFWKEFQHQLIQATYAQVSTTVSAPNLA